MNRILRSAWLCAALMLSACGSEETIEDQIKAVITEMERQAEAGERRPFMTHVADDFVGQNGMTRDEFRGFFVLQLNQHERIEAQLLPISVEHNNADRARAEFRALLTGGPGLLPDNGQLFDFKTFWELHDGDWMLSGASWEPVFD